MIRFWIRMLLVLSLAAALSATALGQISPNAPIAGTVKDPSGAVIPGAAVEVKNNANGARYNTVSAENGTWVVPSLSPGTYTVTITASGFKQYVASDVKLMAATPASIHAELQVGAPTETVTVIGAGDVIQTQTATVTQTVVGRQITELPLPWRDSTNLALLFPGANTTGAVRSTTFLGLASSAVNIMVDGVNTQEQYYKNYSDYFGFVSARLDAIEEATVTTAATTADSAGQGAVQLKFVTRQGGNQYHGSLYEYHRNTKLNANYWFNNRDIAPDKTTGKAPRNRIRLNQAGGRVGGPIIVPKLFDGHDKAFFFLNVENYELPARNTRQRTILNPLTEQGTYRWVVSGGAVREQNILTLANSKGQFSTVDPTVSKLLADIRATTSAGSVAQTSDPNLMQFTYLAAAREHHIYPTLRLDMNLNRSNRLEFTTNIQRWRRYKDAVNNADPNFPGFPTYGDTTSTRYSHSLGMRSTLSSTLVNEVRAGLTGGSLHFYENTTKDDFNGPVANQAGFSLNFPLGLTGATYTTNPSRRNSPLWTFADNLTKQLGAHSIGFGVTLTHVAAYTNNHLTVPSVSFGVDGNYDPARVLFDAVNGPVNFPGMSSFSNPANLYAFLTGRVTGISGNAYLDEVTNKYVYIGDRVNRGKQNELGFYLQDGWRTKSNLTLNYGVRWQLQFPFTPGNSRFTTTTFADLFGISGTWNLFKPGTMTGRETQFIQFDEGADVFAMKYNALAPTVGFAWTPNFENGILKSIFGANGRTVLRGGYSVSFNQPSIGSFLDFFSGNPGTYITAARSVANNNLVANNATDFPLLFLGGKGKLGPPNFDPNPKFPFTATQTDSVSVYGPEMKIPYVQSWNFGIQRELGKDMALEVRYVGNISLQALTSFALNEINWQANGFFDEFKLAMANFQANVAASRGNTFKYFGPGTNTSPLPVILAYFTGTPSSQAGDTSKYTGTNWTNTTYVNQLGVTNPNPSSFASSLFSDPTRRANALAGGVAANYFVANPGLNGVTYRGNGDGNSHYDSAVVELRRRMSKGLMLQTSYTFAKGWTNSTISLRRPRVSLPNTGVVDHTLRANWIYELPFGSGKALATPYKVTNKIIDNWEVNGVLRWQTGPLFNLGNVRLVGMTRDELQQAIQLWSDPAKPYLYMLPQDLIDNTIKANNTSATGTTGYSALGVPTGRYIAPANSQGCIELYRGDCGGSNIVLRGKPFTRVDISLIKKNRITENVNFELRGEILNAFNFANFTTNSLGTMSSQTFAQVTSAYRDIANANETGGRMIQLVLRLNF